MIVAYLYNRPVSEGEAMGCEKVFADWKGTQRADLVDMIERRGIREGDTLRLRALSDLGQGREATLRKGQIEARGVTVEVIPDGSAPKQRGRPARLKPSDEQKEHLCSLWYSPAPIEHVLTRAADILGAEVDRNRMNYWCGPRDGSRKK